MDSVKVREYTFSDLQQVYDIMETEWPNCKTPNINDHFNWPFKTVCEIDGQIRCATLGSVEIESHVVLDKTGWGTPHQKMEAIHLTQQAFLRSMRERGLTSTYAHVHKDTEKTFHKRLRQLGWEKLPDWSLWLRLTGE
jgi:hypothetical protein